MGTKTIVGVKRSREEDLDTGEVETVAEAMLDLVPRPNPSDSDKDGSLTINGDSIANGDSQKDKKSSKKSKKKKKSKVWCTNNCVSYDDKW